MPHSWHFRVLIAWDVRGVGRPSGPDDVSSPSVGGRVVDVERTGAVTGGAAGDGVGIAREAPLGRGAVTGAGSSAFTGVEARPTTEFRNASSSKDGPPDMGAGVGGAGTDAAGATTGSGAGTGGTTGAAGDGVEVLGAIGGVTGADTAGTG